MERGARRNARVRNKFLNTGTPGYHPITKIKIMVGGFLSAMRYDLSVAYKVLISVVLLSVLFFMRMWVDFLLIFVATSQMLMAEIFNSAIEAICDFVETHEDEKIKLLKDMAAAATGVSILTWLLVVIYEVAGLLL
jgi:diacylglycerol kinase (ATP)